MQPLFQPQSAFYKLAVFSFIYMGICFYGYAQPKIVSTSSNAKGDTIIKSLKPDVGSNTYYRIYIGGNYSLVKHNKSKHPFAASHTIGLNYSISENSFHPYYQAFFPQAIGNWYIAFKGGYDGIRRTNFYGIGNETKKTADENKFNWLRTHNQYASLGIGRLLGNDHRINWNILYDGIQVLNDENRFIAKGRGTIDPEDFNWQHFLGTGLSYSYTRLNNPELPTKGIDWTNAVAYQQNLDRSGHSFGRYATDLEAYLPLYGSFSFALRTGLSTLSGNPDFYQYNTVGGGSTLRGYYRARYYGKTAFYNQNELRWITNVVTNSVNGHVGFLVFYDQGRVWQPGENSDKMHFGYGPGILLSPFDRIVVTTTFAISNEDKRINFRVGKLF